MKTKEAEMLDFLLTEIEKPVLHHISASLAKQKPIEKKLIVSIEEYLGIEPGKYTTYYELEGNIFPDLWRRAEEKDDIDSKTKSVALPRGNKFYVALYFDYLSRPPKNIQKS